MIENQKDDLLNTKLYSICESKALQLIDPALGNLSDFIFCLMWYCCRAGVQGQFAYNKAKDIYLPNKLEVKGLEKITAYCYDSFDTYGVFAKLDLATWPKPYELDKIKRLSSYVKRELRQKEDWDDKRITKCSKSRGLKRLLVEGIVTFFNEQCEYEKWAAFGIDGLHFLIENKMEIFRNVLNDTLGYRCLGTQHELRPMNANVLWVFADRNGYTGKDGYKVNEIDAYLKSGMVKEYDPIYNYFAALPEWDGVDHISTLASYVKIKAGKENSFKEHFRKALIRNVGCGLGEMINRCVIVLSGDKQNTGKSSFIRFLCPDQLAQNYTDAPLRGNKDDYFKLSETFIYNLEELSTLNSRDVNELKAFISASSSNERKPYDRDSKVRTRRTNFWASTNKDQFLVDDTGNSRWLIFEVDDIDWRGYIKVIDINQVWAQAYHYYKQGERGELSFNEVEEQTKSNTEFEVRSLEHEFILEYFKPSAAETGEFWTNYRLAEFFATATPRSFNLNQVILGRAMKQLGFETGRKWLEGRTQRGYWLEKAGRPNFNKDYRYNDEPSEKDWRTMFSFGTMFSHPTNDELDHHPYFVNFIEVDYKNNFGGDQRHFEVSYYLFLSEENCKIEQSSDHLLNFKRR